MDGCHGHAKRQSLSVDWAHACFQQQMLMMGRLAWTKSQGIGTANFLHKFLMRRGRKLPHGPLALHQTMAQKTRIWNCAHHLRRCAALSPQSTFRALSGKTPLKKHEETLRLCSMICLPSHSTSARWREHSIVPTPQRFVVGGTPLKPNARSQSAARRACWAVFRRRSSACHE